VHAHGSITEAGTSSRHVVIVRAAGRCLTVAKRRCCRGDTRQCDGWSANDADCCVQWSPRHVCAVCVVQVPALPYFGNSLLFMHTRPFVGELPNYTCEGRVSWGQPRHASHRNRMSEAFLWTVVPCDVAKTAQFAGTVQLLTNFFLFQPFPEPVVWFFLSSMILVLPVLSFSFQIHDLSYFFMVRPSVPLLSVGHIIACSSWTLLAVASCADYGTLWLL